MELLMQALDWFLHIDDKLGEVINNYGMWTYAILFLIIFCETGLVVTPFLPGDSLLFAAGALSATTSMNPVILFVLLLVAAIIGDSLNYAIGSYVGTRIFKEDAKILKLSHLRRTEKFYEKYGGKTIFLARFVPIVRTYAPFVAGAANMRYSYFFFYNCVGALAWVGGFIFLGYFFGNLPVVKENFGIVVLGIIIVSVLPIVYEIGMGWLEKRKAQAGGAESIE
ncbi:membrane-associated protein [Bradymonas sediminis]|nr:DedA family protein [Bradymonas sediminis]TDP76700.1 membrane-associated protein [Bradymonas sediminis]